MLLSEPPGKFLPDALGDEVVGLPRSHHAAHEIHGFFINPEAEARGEARDPQDAHRVLGEGLAHMAQYAIFQIAFSTKGVYESPLLALRHGVDGQVAAPEIVLERDVGGSLHREALVAAAALPLGGRNRVLLVRLRVQEHRKVLADRLEALRDHLFRRCTDYNE